MKRRGFLKALGLAPAAALGAKLVLPDGLDFTPGPALRRFIQMLPAGYTVELMESAPAVVVMNGSGGTVVTPLGAISDNPEAAADSVVVDLVGS